MLLITGPKKHNQSDVPKIFSISRGSLASWLKKVQTTGEVSDSPRKAYKVRKIDSDLLLAAFDKNPDATLEEIAKQFNFWPQSIHKRCVKLGINRKKTTLYAEINEEKKASIFKQDRANQSC